jgi:6-phosphogluconolactonase (cycloisomerase 2 family)
MTPINPRLARLLLAASSLSLPLLLAQPGLAQSARPSPGSDRGDVYVLSNQTSGNSVMVYHRDASGALSFVNSYATGGNGAGSGADPLGSQNPVVLTRNGQLLLAVNAGSDSISAFQVSGDTLVPVNTVSSGGTMPVSLAVRHDLVYVLNAGGTPNISGFAIDPETGALAPLANSTQALPGGAGSGPAEVSFANSEGALMVTETATNQIDTFVLNADGTPQAGVAFPSTEPTPFGFAFRRGSPVAVVSDAGGGVTGASALSSFSVAKDGTLNTITAGVGDTQTAACWVALTKNGRFAYTSNTASGTISSFGISHNGRLALLAVSAATGNVPVDTGMSRDSRYLYARNAGDGTISGFRIRSDGSLTAVGSASGLPDGAAGLAAR